MILYIDPGTGSMLFSILIGVVAIIFFMLKAFWIKIKFFISGGKVDLKNSHHVPFVIYSEDKRYWTVFEPIINEFEKRRIEITYLTSSEDDPFFNERFEYIQGLNIGKGNKAFTKLNLLEADVCIMTTPGLDVYQLKRSKGTKHYSHILHAVDDATSYRLFGLDYFDSVLLSGEYQIKHLRQLEHQRNLKEKELIVVGSTYLDSLNNSLSEYENSVDSTSVILVAPSWGNSSLLNKYGERLLTPLIETGFHIIVRPHPQTLQNDQKIIDSLISRYRTEPKLEWDFERNNLKSLSRASLMISDFSGVIFDYTFLFRRPVLYSNVEFDSRPYDSWDIDETPWKFEVLQKIGVELKEEDFSHIKDLIYRTIDNTTLFENINIAKAKAWNNQGEAGIKVVDYLVEKQKSISKAIAR